MKVYPFVGLIVLLALAEMQKAVVSNVLPQERRVQILKALCKKFPRKLVKQYMTKYIDSGRRLNRIFSGTTLGTAGMIAGGYMAIRDRKKQKQHLKAMFKSIRSQQTQLNLLELRNRKYYEEMDGLLTDAEEKLEDMADEVLQKVSEFDISVRSKLAGQPFMPSFTYS